ncbi:MAG: FAD binding domain-containing protein [Microbacteriaceae bacterium]
MKPCDFSYRRPGSVSEAIDLLRSEPASFPLAGGQSLMPALALREQRASMLVDIAKLDELHGVFLTDDTVSIGAAVPMWDLERSDLVHTHLPLLALALSTVGAPGIRSRATLGGSAGWADSTSQLPATLAALNATMVTSSRRLSTDEFFISSGRTALDHDELVLRIEISTVGRHGYGLQLVRRSHITWPVAGAAAVCRSADSFRVALFGVAAAPVLIDAAGAADAAEHAAGLTVMYSDERASSTYRQSVIPVLARRAVEDASLRES